MSHAVLVGSDLNRLCIGPGTADCTRHCAMVLLYSQIVLLSDLPDSNHSYFSTLQPKEAGAMTLAFAVAKDQLSVHEDYYAIL